MSHKDALKLLFPLRLEGRFDEDVQIEGDHLDDAEESADTLLANLVPNNIDSELLRGWEETLAIWPPYGSTVDQRFDAVVAKLREGVGLSKPYFVALALTLGYEVEIEDIRPFESGVGMCGWPVMATGIKWCWLVRVTNHATEPSDFVGKTPVAVTAEGDGWLWRWDAIGGVLERTLHTLSKSGGMPLFVYPVE